jgi:hypothetical protein
MTSMMDGRRMGGAACQRHIQFRLWPRLMAPDRRHRIDAERAREPNAQVPIRG